MYKEEKEVIQSQLDAEKSVIEELKKQYQRALNDINRKIRILQSDELTQSKIYQLQYQKVLKSQVEAILEKLHADEYSTIQKYLSESYTNAFIGTMYAMHGQNVPVILPINQNAAVKAVMTDSKIKEGLYKSLGVDVNNLKKAISSEITRGIATAMPYNEIARNIAAYTKTPYSRSKTIVRTEAHRIQQAATLDAQNGAKAKGADVVKQWDSTLDGDTRPTHRRLDGQIREIDKPFEMDGKEAMYPGDFGDPAEDCNCRCVSLTRARWALDKDELKTLQDRAKFFGLDKTEDFKDFEKKYLNATRNDNLPLENAGKSGIIKERNTTKGIGIQYFAKMPEDKFTAYSLNPEKAPDKATAFKEALGYDLSNYALLMQNINDHIDESKFVEKGDIGYGMRYEFVLELEGINGKKANVLTAWIQDGDEKRLVSVYVTEKKVTE